MGGWSRVLIVVLSLWTAAAAAAAPAVVAGGQHSLALHADGTVRAWGSDSHGELGIGTVLATQIPVQVVGLPPIRTGAGSVSVQGGAFAIGADGSLWSWGWNHGGMLGDGTTADRSSPVRVANLHDVVAVSAGAQHSLAVTANGDVWTWGVNHSGSLGTGDGDWRSRPIRIALTAATSVAGGSEHSLVLGGDGRVWAFGANAVGQLGDGTTSSRLSPTMVANLTGVVAIASGGYHSLALKGDGTVWAWGHNDRGQLGDGSTTQRLVPTQVQGLSGVVDIAASLSASYAVKADGSVWRWGARPVGADSAIAVQVDGYDNARRIRATPSFSVVLRADGTVWRQGANGPPEPVSGLAGVVAVAAGGDRALAVGGDGRLFAWGSNWNGGLGIGTLISRTAAALIPGLTDVVQVAAGGWSHAVRADGTVLGWGGIGGSEGSSPMVVPGLTGVVQMASGVHHAVALRSDGTVWTWGKNDNGQLGRGPLGGDQIPPGPVPGLSGVVRVAAADWRTMVVRSDGTVWAWGLNNDDTLGVAPTAQCLQGTTLVGCTPAPAQVPGIDSVVDIAMSPSHALALRSDGGVWAWGNNTQGALGRETAQLMTPVPGPVAGLSGVRQVAAAGNIHRPPASIALKHDGTVWTWGDNFRGQLGMPSVPWRAVPGLVEGLSGIAQVSAGGLHILARRSDGVLFVWGGNPAGQLGDGTYVDRPRPAVVLRDGAAGTLDGDDWYLDLDPATPNTSIPLAATPGLVAVAQRAGSDTDVVLDAVARFKGADLGKALNVYVLAQVPPAFFDQVKLAPGAKSAAQVRAKTGEALVLAQLTPQGWTNATGQLIAYSQGVGNAAGAAASILDGINTATIPGARFCIGYGESADAMLGSMALRDVLEVAGASATASGVPCVLSGVYVGGPAASRLGTPVTFTASVVGLSPTGAVQFFDGAAALSAGVALTAANEAVAKASLTTSSLAAGLHGIAASYGGDSQNASVPAASSTPLRHEVSAPPGGTRVDLTGPVSSQLGEPVVFSATVTGNNPGGTVQFRDGAANLGNAVPLVEAAAVLTASGLAAGAHTITAVYSGDGGNAASTSNALTHTVYASIATRVALATSANPAAQGAAVTLTATVTGTSPAGSVAFRDGATVVATVPLANGAASATLSNLGAGLHVMVADYLGDATNPAASSPALFQQVTPAGATLGAFASRLDVAVSTAVTSNAVLVTGVGAGQPLAVTGGEYSIGCTGTFTSAAGTVTEGQRVCVRHMSSAAFATTTRTTLVVGTATADFTSTTMTAAFRAAITALVSHYYQAVLRRAADAGGQAYWEAEGLRVHTLGGNIAETFYAMAMAFFGSAEYAALNRDNGGYATDLYAAFFSRAPDPGGLAHWSGQLASGLPRDVLLATFMFSPEFAAYLAERFGHRPARSEVDMVGDFYRGLLGRLPDSTGLDFWVRRFRVAQCAGSAQVIAEVEAISSAFATGAEYAARARDNTRHVGDLYNAFLRRGGDLQGVQFWIQQLTTGARAREQLRREFVASPEFSARVNAVVAQGCY